MYNEPYSTAPRDELCTVLYWFQFNLHAIDIWLHNPNWSYGSANKLALALFAIVVDGQSRWIWHWHSYAAILNGGYISYGECTQNSLVFIIFITQWPLGFVNKRNPDMFISNALLFHRNLVYFWNRLCFTHRSSVCSFFIILWSSFDNLFNYHTENKISKWSCFYVNCWWPLK